MDEDTAILPLDMLASQVGEGFALRLMHHLHEENEAQKVIMQQEVDNLGRMDRAVDHFYDEEVDGCIDMLIPPGAYVYWWLESQKRGGKPGDFWRDDESVNWFKKKNRETVVHNRCRNARSGYNGLLEGTKYGDVRKDAAAA